MSAGRVPARNVVVFWGIALGGMAFDLASKWWVFSRLALGETRPIIDGLLELHPSRNQGALWGFGSNLPYSSLVFAGLSVVAALAICYWLFVRGAASDLRLTAALGLIMAGALGNCFDRLVFGYVRDFVYFHVDSINFAFAIFNFADNMLVLGAAGLMILALRPDPHPAALADAEKPEPITSGEAAPPA